jgi:hypothetical protein
MPEDLLQELQIGNPAAESLEKIEQLVLVHERDVGLAVEGMRGSFRVFENIWQQIVMDVAKGQTTEVQTARQQLLLAFQKRLNLLRLYHALATLLHESDKMCTPAPDVLAPEIAGLERLKAEVFDRWQSAEDLEELAARDYPLTTEYLDRVGPNRQPPASYYAEENKPF